MSSIDRPSAERYQSRADRRSIALGFQADPIPAAHVVSVLDGPALECGRYVRISAPVLVGLGSTSSKDVFVTVSLATPSATGIVSLQELYRAEDIFHSLCPARAKRAHATGHLVHMHHAVSGRKLYAIARRRI